MLGGRSSEPAAESIGVVIPCLNEERLIRRTLESVTRQNGPVEIIVADGGSTDCTCAIGREYGRVVVSERGRAKQMNAGAAAARSGILLFLHADTSLPPRAFDVIRQTLRDPQIEAGAFRLRFDRSTPLLRLYSACTRFRSSLLSFGDRGLFVRRSVFAQVGGFPRVPLFEDLEMAQALSRRGGFVFLDNFVTTSARRFLQYGSLRQQMRNAFLWIHYMIGTDPRRLTHLYPYRSAE